MSNNKTKNISILLESVPIILTIGFGVFITLKAQVNDMETNKLLSWILGILCLLATSMLIDRFTKLKRIENYSKEVNELLKTKKGKVSIETILSTRKYLAPLEERLQSAKEVMITGGSLFRLSSEYIGLFEKLASEGCKMKFLLLNPDAESAKLTAENIVYEISDYQTYKSYIHSSINSLRKLKNKFPDLVEVKTSDYLPSFGIFGIDMNKDNGKIMIELYTHDVPTRERSHFQLQVKREPFWYNFFLEQFNTVWKNGNPLVQ